MADVVLTGGAVVKTVSASRDERWAPGRMTLVLSALGPWLHLFEVCLW